MYKRTLRRTLEATPKEAFHNDDQKPSNKPSNTLSTASGNFAYFDAGGGDGHDPMPTFNMPPRKRSCKLCMPVGQQCGPEQ